MTASPVQRLNFRYPNIRHNGTDGLAIVWGDSGPTFLVCCRKLNRCAKLERMNKHPVSGTEGYASEAPLLFERYEQFDFMQVHAPVLHLFPTKPSRVVDIGAGTGRDAVHMASLGHSVLAVEPTSELREPAKLIRKSQNLEWLDDSLPDLPKLLSKNETFDIVMLNAVWMHLGERQRNDGMRQIARLTHLESRVFMSLRHGPIPNGRRMFDVSGNETVELAQQHGFKALFNVHSESIQKANRIAGVSWTRVVLERSTNISPSGPDVEVQLRGR